MTVADEDHGPEAFRGAVFELDLFVGGCRRCPDKGRRGYERFLQTAVLANNLVTLGRWCWAQDDTDALPAQTRRGVA